MILNERATKNMLNPSKTKIKKTLTCTKNKNVKKVISVMRGLRQPQTIKSKLNCKDINAEIRNTSFKKRKNPPKQIYCRNTEEGSGSQNSKKRTLKKTQILNFYKNDLNGNGPRNKLNIHPRSGLQRITPQKEHLLNIIFKCSEDLGRSSSSAPIFVCLSDTDENKKGRNKFRKPASGRKLKRLRENLWKKSSYHQRFLGKGKIVKSQKTEKEKKNKIAKSKRKRLLTRKRDLNVKKSGVKNSKNDNDFIRERVEKNPERHTLSENPSNRDDLDVKKEEKISQEMLPLDSNTPPTDDISKVDESYIKSLLSIAKCSIKSENTEIKHQGKSFCNSSPETENKTKMTGKEFFIRKMKNKKTPHGFVSKNAENKTNFTLLPVSDNTKDQQNSREEENNSANILRDATKSETEIRLCKKKATDIENKEVRHAPIKAYSKHEINNYQQKKKTRNIVKNKKEDNIEMPFPCEVSKTKEVQELWKKENFGIPQSCDSSSTMIEDVTDQNLKGMGMESYRILKKIVEDEMHRISHKCNRIADNPQKEICKEQNATFNEKQISDLVRKKLAAKSRDTFSQEEKQCRKPDNLHYMNLLQGGKLEKVKSKLNLQEGKRSPTKKSPDEMIKNWSIVNRLEQAFLALGTPDFRKIKEKEPVAINAKGMRAIERNASVKKQVEKKTKEPERNEKKPATHVAVNKQKVTELNKPCVNEKQLNVLHKKESTLTSRKLDTPFSAPSTMKSSKVDRRTKPKEEKASLQPAPPCKPWIKPTDKLTNKSGIKSTTQPGNLPNARNEVPGSRQTAKLGKKSSSRNLLCESSTQNKNDDDNLERKKTFPIISLKDSVIMQPRRSKSCNKIDRSSEVDGKNNYSFSGSHECKTLISINKREKSQDFFDRFERSEEIKSEEELKRNESKADEQYEQGVLKNSSSKGVIQIFERSKNSFEESVKDTPSKKLNQEKGCDETVPKDLPLALENSNKGIVQTLERLGDSSEESIKNSFLKKSNQEKKYDKLALLELPEHAIMMKDVNSGSKARAIKERSILSIRTNQHENQSSRTNISQIEEKCTSTFFQIDNSDLPKTNIRRDGKKVDVFLSPTNINYSESSWTSTGTYDLSESESSVENKARISNNDNELELLKAPLMSSNESIQIISSQAQTESGEKLKKIKNAPWEEDINYYRALVREIMSQYKRLDGFLKQSENTKTLPEDSEGLKMSSEEEQVEVLKKQINIQEYRKKIMLEYQEVPIIEYKSKMQELQEKLDGKGKRRNLLVVQPMDAEIDLDVKDYEPRMRTVLNSRLYFDKENITKRQEIIKNPKDKKLSLQEVTLCKDKKSENNPKAVSTHRSSFCNSSPRDQNLYQNENKPEENRSDVEFSALMPNFNKL